MDHVFLSKTLLFRNISPEAIEPLLACLSAQKKTYPKGSTVLRAGDPVSSIGLVLSGGVSLEHDDPWGNKSILDQLEPGQAFAETYACVPGEPLMINVVAAQTSEILFLNVGQSLRLCSNSCRFHNQLIENLLFIASRKNLSLSRRIFHTSSKSIRGRLLSYLSFQATEQKSRDFVIPFNRQQLADYLSVDRSAMSNELSKMQRDGLLKVERNHFTLLTTTENEHFNPT